MKIGFHPMARLNTELNKPKEMRLGVLGCGCGVWWGCGVVK